MAADGSKERRRTTWKLTDIMKDKVQEPLNLPEAIERHERFSDDSLDFFEITPPPKKEKKT